MANQHIAKMIMNGMRMPNERLGSLEVYKVTWYHLVGTYVDTYIGTKPVVYKQPKSWTDTFLRVGGGECRVRIYIWELFTKRK
jgi:hypothetical protein